MEGRGVTACHSGVMISISNRATTPMLPLHCVAHTVYTTGVCLDVRTDVC